MSVLQVIQTQGPANQVSRIPVQAGQAVAPLSEDYGPSPVVLRLKLLDLLRNETTIVDPAGSSQITDIQHEMAQCPSASLADVLAKLRTARMSSGLWSDRMDLKLIESAISDLERLPAL